MKRIGDRSRKNRRRSALVVPSVVLFLLAAYLLLPAGVWQMFEPRVAAATFTVTNTSDSNAGSLRDAIVGAINTAGADTITFNIPPNDPRHFYYVNDGVPGTVSRSMIAVTASSDDASIGDIDPDWPHSWYSIETAGFVGGSLIGTSVTIDGLSQPGSVPNTNPSGSLNSVLKIEVTNSTTDGSCSRIFQVAFEPVAIRGMVINGCSQSSEAREIDFDFASHGSIAAGNYIGTDPSGKIGLGSGYGVHITQASGVTVGGNSPEDRNLISGNFRGVNANNGGVSNAGFSGINIIGNLIGTKRDGISALGNGFHPEQPTHRQDGVVLIAPNGSTSDNRVENNVIAFSARYGINIATGGVGTGTSTVRNRFLNNSIHSNGNIGIQVEGIEQTDFVTPNDPCDADVGLNLQQNFPVIKNAVISGGTIAIAATLNSTPGGTYHLEFFASPATDLTYFGEGQTVLGSSTVDIPAGSCNGTFDVSLPLPAGAGNVITATATDAVGNTSEFSAVYLAQSQSNSCTLRPDGLVSWYSAQGNANDSQSENHGKFFLSPPQYTTGKVGQAFNLTGRHNADVVEVPDVPDLDFTNAFSFEMWVAPAEAGLATGQSFFISKGDLNNVGTQSYGIMFTPDRKVVNRVGNGAAIDQLVSTSAIPLNEFTHIATTYDGTTLRVYINGVPDGSQATSIGTLLNTSGPLVIGGAYFNSSPLSVTAVIDEPSLYNRALSDAEIASIFGAGSAGKCKIAPPPPTPTPTPTPTPLCSTPDPVIINGDLTVVNTGDTVINLSCITTVTGDLILTGNSAGVISMSEIGTVGGSVEISGNTAAGTISMAELDTVGGTVEITGNTSAGTISLADLGTVGGSVEISGNTAAGVISMGELGAVAGDLDITDNGAATVEVGGLQEVSGNVTIDSSGTGTFTLGDGSPAGNLDLDLNGYTSVSGSTAGGETSVSNATAEAVMSAQLPDGAFTTPVTFSITHQDPAALVPTDGALSNGTPAIIDPVSAYQFTFGVPTLNQNASLTFDILLDGLDASTRTALLEALANGRATLATKGDAAGSTYQAFAICAVGEAPTPDGCVVVETLDANGQPTTGTPAIIRFSSVVGHFSTWAVVTHSPVGYNFTGFFEPVDNLPVVNIATAGSSIPLKFSLGGNQGLNIFAPGYPASVNVACDANDPTGAIDETVNAGGSSLSYDPATDRYTYVWKTSKSWKGTCRLLRVRFDDGSEHFAKFRFR